MFNVRMLVCVSLFSFILTFEAMAASSCYNLFKSDLDQMPVSDLLTTAGVEFSDLLDFIVVKPTGGAKLNQLARWVQSTLGQKLVLLTQVTYAVDRELEEPDVMVVYWPTLLVLLSERLSMKELKLTLYNDFQTRRARQKFEQAEPQAYLVH